jgi:hypothetical protein
MIGKKKLKDVRKSVRKRCGPSAADLIKSLDSQIQQGRHGRPLKSVEIETLNMIRDGLRKRRKTTKAAGKRARTR